MDGPDYPQEGRPGTPSNVPSLIHDYRAQREAWREQARNLARMREEVLSAADREAHDIVSSARADIKRILLKARRDLLVLAAQVRAAGRLGEAEDAPEASQFLPADDLGQAQDVLASARLDVRRVLDESRPELEGLVSESDALRAALRQQRPHAPGTADVRRQVQAPPIRDVVALDALTESPPLDFELTSIAAEEDDADLTIRRNPRRLVQAFIVTAAMLGGIAVMGTWLFYRPDGPPATAPSVGAKAEGAASAAAPTSRTAAAARTAGAASARAGALSLNVTARRSAWVRVTSDGRVTTERILRQGETERISAAREISIRAGDGGAVMVSVNGQQPVALGREGEVITRRFPAESPRQQPASPPPATSTPTNPMATSTRPATAPSAPAASPAPAQAVGNAPSRAVDTPAVTAPPPAAIVLPPVNQPAAAATARPPATAAERPPAPAPAPTAASLEDTMTSQAVRWLDAYYRQDRATMASISPQVTITDDRGDKERLPRGLNGVQRSLNDVNFRQFGSEAMLTARMTERMENTNAGQMASAVSFISHTWTQRNGAWQLYAVRIMSAATLSKALAR